MSIHGVITKTIWLTKILVYKNTSFGETISQYSQSKASIELKGVCVFTLEPLEIIVAIFFENIPLRSGRLF